MMVGSGLDQPCGLGRGSCLTRHIFLLTNAYAMEQTLPERQPPARNPRTLSVSSSKQLRMASRRLTDLDLHPTASARRCTGVGSSYFPTSRCYRVAHQSPRCVSRASSTLQFVGGWDFASNASDYELPAEPIRGHGETDFCSTGRH